MRSRTPTVDQCAAELRQRDGVGKRNPTLNRRKRPNVIGNREGLANQRRACNECADKRIEKVVAGGKECLLRRIDGEKGR